MLFTRLAFRGRRRRRRSAVVVAVVLAGVSGSRVRVSFYRQIMEFRYPITSDLLPRSFVGCLVAGFDITQPSPAL